MPTQHDYVVISLVLRMNAMSRTVRRVIVIDQYPWVMYILIVMPILAYWIGTALKRYDAVNIDCVGFLIVFLRA